MYKAWSKSIRTTVIFNILLYFTKIINIGRVARPFVSQRRLWPSIDHSHWRVLRSQA